MLLVCAVCLPLGQCSEGNPHLPPASPSISLHLFPRNDRDHTYHYAIGLVNFSLFGVATVLAFVWPLVFVVLVRRAPGPRLAWLIRSLELLLSAGTIYWIYVLCAWDEWLYGAYVACLAVLLYAGVVLFFVFRATRGISLRNRMLAAPSG